MKVTADINLAGGTKTLNALYFNAPDLT